MTPFITAEMSANHLGSLERALRIVDAAARAGADAIKFQTWLPGTMCVSNYRLDHGPWKGRYLADLYEEAHTPWGWHPTLFRAARSLGLVPFSAAFDCESVDFLEALGVDRHKVASFELTDLALIRHMASKGRPLVISTGAGAAATEIRAAREAAAGADVTWLRCVSDYPADPSAFALARSGFPWGLSDHSMGLGVAVAAVTLGAAYVEKHLTLARADGGPDAAFSMEPEEFAQMVRACRQAVVAVDPGGTGCGKQEEPSPLRRSLWAVQPIARGEAFVLGQNVRTARPALGLACSTPLEGRVAARGIQRGEPLTAECIA